jgi:hypothetical protein
MNEQMNRVHRAAGGGRQAEAQTGLRARETVVQSKGPKAGVGGRHGKTSMKGGWAVQCSEGRGLSGGLTWGLIGSWHQWVPQKRTFYKRERIKVTELLSRFKS